MSKFDLMAVGITAGVTRARVAASATDTKVGEPLMTSPTYTSGTSDVNTVIQCADNTPTIGTNEFKGLCAQDFVKNSAGTVTAHYTRVTNFIPYATKVRGKVETAANIDTQSELTGVLNDLTRFHRSSTPVYAIQAGGEAYTGALQICDGNIARGTVDCYVDARAFRSDIS